MNEEKKEFDALVELYTEIKSFKLNNSAEILENFRSKREPKFKLTDVETNRLNLSSTTVCTYALTQYFELWDENKKSEYKDEFHALNEYYDFVIEGLKRTETSEIELLDEFSIFNILSLLKKIQNEIKNKDPEEDDEGIMQIIRELCKQFIKNEFAFVENSHPFIYYKFLVMVEDWAQEISKDIKEKEDEWKKGKDEDKGELNSFVKEIKDKDSKEIFNYFFDRIYDNAKYEMYRQIALYYANDNTLFDVKRLIYSLLIVDKKDRYSNNLIKDKVLELIFKEQLETTGLLPIGHVVNTDFVIENKQINERPVSANPILSSIECFNDMLTHENLLTDLERYQENFRLTYEWIMKRLRKIPDGKLLGWYAEYESIHTPESWVAGHTLLFLKKYCEMLSELIKKSACKYLQAKEPEELAVTWDELYDSYKIKEYIEYMRSNPKYSSSLIFGPPGTGKSTIPKALAKRMKWHYVELTPGIFLAKGQLNIISEANDIFKRLVRMKNTVIFFDEVDQLVKSREKGGDEWIVTAILPKFADLWNQKEIKFILVTNDITEVDPAVMRSGRIDFILPMGGISWRGRLKIVSDAIDNSNDQIKERLKQEILGDIQLKQIDAINKNSITNEKLRRFLERTNYVPALEIKRIIEILFNKDSWEEVEKDDLYNRFSEGKGEIRSYERTDFRDFHEDLHGVLRSNIKLPYEIPREERDIINIIEDNIF